jgi:hypothetical protein
MSPASWPSLNRTLIMKRRTSPPKHLRAKEISKNFEQIPASAVP